MRTDKADPTTQEEATAIWRVTVKDPDERKAEENKAKIASLNGGSADQTSDQAETESEPSNDNGN